MREAQEWLEISQDAGDFSQAILQPQAAVSGVVWVKRGDKGRRRGSTSGLTQRAHNSKQSQESGRKSSKVRQPGHMKDSNLPLRWGPKVNHDELVIRQLPLGLKTRSGEPISCSCPSAAADRWRHTCPDCPSAELLLARIERCTFTATFYHP